MSLINDALKRASHKPLAPAPPPGGPPLQPVETPPRGTGPLPIILCIVGIGALLMAGAFWIKSRGTPGVPVEQLAQQKSPTTPTENVTPSAPIEFKPTAQKNAIDQAAATSQKVEPPNAAPESNQVLAAASRMTLPAGAPPAEPIKTQPAPASQVEPAKTQPAAAAAEPVAIQPAAPPAPSFRLQAIYYRMRAPTVVINGKTVRVGDSVDGAKLVSIERTSAEIEFQGRREKLTMH